MNEWSDLPGAVSDADIAVLERDRELTIVKTFHPSPQVLFVKNPAGRAARVARRREAFFDAAELIR